MTRVNVAFRPATDADRTFVEHAYFQTQRYIIEALFGWRGDEEENAKFADFYDMAATSIIVRDGTDIGWMAVRQQADHIELEHLYIEEPRQGRGIGSTILRGLIEETETAALPLRLATAKMNRARRLYERFGFAEIGTDEFKVYMEYRPRFRLERPSPKRIASFVAMRDACLAAGDDMWTEAHAIAHSDPTAYVAALQAWATCEVVPQWGVPAETFWVVGNDEVIGECDVRHRLTERLREMGGHIGYVVRPDRRGLGVATFSLRECLNVLAARGESEALVTCAPSNAASIRVIEKCGGRRIADGTRGRSRFVFDLNVPKPQ